MFIFLVLSVYFPFYSSFLIILLLHICKATCLIEHLLTLQAIQLHINVIRKERIKRFGNDCFRAYIPQPHPRHCRTPCQKLHRTCLAPWPWGQRTFFSEDESMRISCHKTVIGRCETVCFASKYILLQTARQVQCNNSP